MENSYHQIGNRIIVVGTSGSGKTSFAASLAAYLNFSHIELDELYWQENWTETPTEEFIAKIQACLEGAGDKWVIDGNYRLSRPILWPQADTVVWLDYPLWIIYWRLFRRTTKRVFSRELLWTNNREEFRYQFFSKDSIFLWAHQTYQQRRDTYSQIIANNEYPNIHFLHFQHPNEAKVFLESLKKNAQ